MIFLEYSLKKTPYIWYNDVIFRYFNFFNVAGPKPRLSTCKGQKERQYVCVLYACGVFLEGGTEGGGISFNCTQKTLLKSLAYANSLPFVMSALMASGLAVLFFA